MVVRRRHVVELPERAAPPPGGEPREDRAGLRCRGRHPAASRVRERGLLRGRPVGPRCGPRQVGSRPPGDDRDRDAPRRRERGRQGGHRLLDPRGGLRDRRRRGRPRQHRRGRRAGLPSCQDRSRAGDGVTRLFGTNGIRGVIGPEMNADLAVKVGRAIGTFVSGGAVALARDPRLSGPMLARAAASGLMAAGCVMTPYLLRSLGCRVLSLNAQPDGAFPGRLPEPTPDHLGDLIRVVREMHADIGIAHDGDADRATFVDDQGAFVVGDKSLALLARSAVKSRGGTVVTPVSTSTVVEDVVRAAGGTVVRTRVGSPIVARTMFETGAVFGGEENGGAIFPEHQFCRDGAMSAAKMLEILAHEGQALSALVAALPQYHIKKSNVSVPVERREAVLASIVELAKGRKVDTTDGVKILEKDGAVLVRPSGTEPIFRVYAEARTPARADALADEGVALVKKALGGR